MNWGQAARALLAAGAVAAAASGAAAAKPAQVGVRETLLQIGAAAGKRDCKAVMRLGEPLLDRRAASVPAEILPAMYEVIAGCEVQANALDKAAAYARAGSDLEGSSDNLWQLRFLTELGREDWAASVAALEAMQQGRGAALNGLPSEAVWELYRRVKDKGDKPLLRRLLKVAASDDYYPDDNYGPADELRLKYAGLAAEGGDSAEARAAVARVRSPRGLVRAMLDPRLAGFVPAGTDVRAAAEAVLGVRRQLIGRYPDKLGPVVEAAGDLRLLGRPKEALALLESVRAQVGNPEAFTDRERALPWWWQGLASGHVALGEYEAAMTAYRGGAAVTEMGQLNVSQVINMAQTQVDFGKPAEALKTLAAFDSPDRRGSPFGEMQLHWTRGCAYHLTGDAGKAATELAYVKAHEKDAPGALSDLLLCMGDMDGAAASYIRRLADPDQRVDVLIALSDYDDPPVQTPEGPVAAALEKLTARPDVAAAVKAAGGARRFNVQEGEL